MQSLKTNFEADLEQLDLSTPFNCEVAADRINKWVEETTKNKISTIINKSKFNRHSDIKNYLFKKFNYLINVSASYNYRDFGRQDQPHPCQWSVLQRVLEG